jgi:hypothetical protein
MSPRHNDKKADTTSRHVRVVLAVALAVALSTDMNRPLKLPGVLTSSSDWNEVVLVLDGSVSSSCRLVRARKSSTQCTQIRLSFFRP